MLYRHFFSKFILENAIKEMHENHEDFDLNEDWYLMMMLIY